MNRRLSEDRGLYDRAYSLFVLGAASVRFTRVTHGEGSAILTVHGPGPETAVFTCATRRDCLEKQGQIESALVAAGYAHHPDAERRIQPDRRRFPRGDRRRRVA